MDFDPAPQDTGNPIPLDQPLAQPPYSYFHNEKGLRSGWRLLIYIPLVLLLYVVAIIPLAFVARPLNLLSLRAIALGELTIFAAVYGAALIMAQIEGRSNALYGLPPTSAFGRRFWQGIFLGLCEVSAIVGAIAAFGGYSFGTLSLHGAKIIQWGALWFLAALLIGLSEEFMFRGYVQYTLAEGIGFWPAAVILSALFGCVHWTNQGESWVGVLNIFLTGLLWAFVLRRTGSLWLAVGWHAAFDFGESFLYSVPDSGGIFEGHLSNAVVDGPKWLTGGSVGPEASVFSFVTVALGALLIHFWFPAKPKTQSAS